MEKHTAQWPVNQRSQSRSVFPPSGANACAGAPTHPLPFSLVTSYRQAVTCLPLATYFFLQPSRCLACLKRSGKVLQVKPNPPISHRVCNFGVYCKIFFHSPHTAEQSPSPPELQTRPWLLQAPEAGPVGPRGGGHRARPDTGHPRGPGSPGSRVPGVTRHPRDPGDHRTPVPPRPYLRRLPPLSAAAAARWAEPPPRMQRGPASSGRRRSAAPPGRAGHAPSADVAGKLAQRLATGLFPFGSAAAGRHGARRGGGGWGEGGWGEGGGGWRRRLRLPALPGPQQEAAELPGPQPLHLPQQVPADAEDDPGHE